jgi:hypothetical protein
MTMNVAKTEQINELAAALAKANLEIKNAELDRVNPHFKNRYATLGSILNAVRVPLAKHGLATLQTVRMEHGCVFVTTLLTHSSGQWIEESAGFPLPDKATVQQMGSCITYLRRYALAAIVGIVGDEDDDGEGDRSTRSEPRREPFKPQAAQGAPAPAARPAPKRTAPVEQATVDGEWEEITVKYVDEGVAGKNQSPYVKLKDTNGKAIMVWDTALHVVARETKGATIWVITEPSTAPNGMPRVVQMRTEAPAPMAQSGADVEIPF